MADDQAPPLEGGDATQPEAPPAEAPRQVTKTRDPNRAITFRYWSRPTTLQYRYLYDFRHNYYDDLIDYMDRRSRGLSAEKPKPQFWAERALRTYLTPGKSTAEAERAKDWELLHQIRACNNVYLYHSRDYITRKYPALAL